MYKEGSVVDLTHNLVGKPQSITAKIVSYDPTSKQLFIVPIKQCGLLSLNEEEIISCKEIKATYDYAIPKNTKATLEQTYTQNLDERQKIADNFKIGASELARYVFASISKTMSCTWEGEAIVVSELCKILPPYDSESCQPMPGSRIIAVQRIKTMVSNINSKYHSS